MSKYSAGRQNKTERQSLKGSAGCAASKDFGHRVSGVGSRVVDGYLSRPPKATTPFVREPQFKSDVEAAAWIHQKVQQLSKIIDDRTKEVDALLIACRNL